MTDQTGSWEPDPFGRNQYRWFDGTTWSDQVSNDSVVSSDPPDPGGAPAPGASAPAEPEPQPAEPEPTEAVAATPPPVAASPAGWGPPGSEPTMAMPPTGAPPPGPAPMQAAASGGGGRGSNTIPLVIGGVALLALLGAGLFFFLGGSDDEVGTSDTTTVTTAAPTTDTTEAPTTTTTQATTDTTEAAGGSEEVPAVILDLFVEGVMQGSDLTEEEARCFSEGFFDIYDGSIEDIIADPEALATPGPELQAGLLRVISDCGISPEQFGAAGGGFPGLGGVDPPIAGQPDTYGDDPTLDALWDACEAGDGQACDDLYFQSPIDSAYEEFGDTCGGRFPPGQVFCANEL